MKGPSHVLDDLNPTIRHQKMVCATPRSILSLGTYMSINHDAFSCKRDNNLGATSTSCGHGHMAIGEGGLGYYNDSTKEKMDAYTVVYREKHGSVVDPL